MAESAKDGTEQRTFSPLDWQDIGVHLHRPANGHPEHLCQFGEYVFYKGQAGHQQQRDQFTETIAKTDAPAIDQAARNTGGRPRDGRTE